MGRPLGANRQPCVCSCFALGVCLCLSLFRICAAGISPYTPLIFPSSGCVFGPKSMGLWRQPISKHDEMEPFHLDIPGGISSIFGGSAPPTIPTFSRSSAPGYCLIACPGPQQSRHGARTKRNTRSVWAGLAVDGGQSLRGAPLPPNTMDNARPRIPGPTAGHPPSISGNAHL